MNLLEAQFVHFISRGAWFDKDTVAVPMMFLTEEVALFRGYRNGKLDEEVCTLDEFEIVGIHSE